MSVSTAAPPVSFTGETRTHCPYCAFQCGMHLEPDALAHPTVRPDPDFPVNRGKMCIKGFNSAALLTNSSRVTSPLLRTARGSLAPVSWDEAFGFVGEKMRAVREKYGNDALGAFGSGALTNEKVYLLGKLVRVAFRSRNVDYNGRYCMASAAAGQNRVFGVDRGMPFPVSDVGETETLVLWGVNTADTMPPFLEWIHEQQRRGGRLIVVDPRRTETARLGQLHLQLRPGTDLALANGLLALAWDLELVDRDYLERRTNGFDEVRRSLSSYEPARVERITGVPLGDMKATVEALSRTSKSMLLSGRGAEQQSKGSDTVVALAQLMLALGKVGFPASGYGTVTGQANGQGGREHGQKADQLPGYRSIESDADRALFAKIWGVPVDAIPRKGKSAFEMLDALGTDEGARSLVVFGSNLPVASPDSQRIEARLRALDLLVVCDSFLNETTEFAHVVLPTKQWAEEDGTVTNLEGRVILRRQVAEAPPGPRGDIEIMERLAAELGVDSGFGYASTEAVFDEFRRATSGSRADYAGITYERLNRESGVFWPCPDESHPGTPRLFAERFFFPDGKARFEVVHHRAAGEEPDEDYPLYFTTGRYREHYNSGAQTRLVDKLTAVRPEPKLQIHPRLATELGVEDGGEIEVESRRARVIFTAEVTTDIRPDTLFAPFHWGGRKAANALTFPALDPTSRMPEFKICAVRARAVRLRVVPSA